VQREEPVWARELATCGLWLVDAREVRWDKGGTARAEDYTSKCVKGKQNYQTETWFFFVQQIVASAVKRVEFVSDRMPCRVQFVSDRMPWRVQFVSDRMPWRVQC
jgi:hypothetical protein